MAQCGSISAAARQLGGGATGPLPHPGPAGTHGGGGAGQPGQVRVGPDRGRTAPAARGTASGGGLRCGPHLPGWARGGGPAGFQLVVAQLVVGGNSTEPCGPVIRPFACGCSARSSRWPTCWRESCTAAWCANPRRGRAWRSRRSPPRSACWPSPMIRPIRRPSGQPGLRSAPNRWWSTGRRAPPRPPCGRLWPGWLPFARTSTSGRPVLRRTGESGGAGLGGGAGAAPRHPVPPHHRCPARHRRDRPPSSGPSPRHPGPGCWGRGRVRKTSAMVTARTRRPVSGGSSVNREQPGDSLLDHRQDGVRASCARSSRPAAGRRRARRRDRGSEFWWGLAGWF